jgi:hypothetical protein
MKKLIVALGFVLACMSSAHAVRCYTYGHMTGSGAPLIQCVPDPQDSPNYWYERGRQEAQIEQQAAVRRKLVQNCVNVASEVDPKFTAWVNGLGLPVRVNGSSAALAAFKTCWGS